MLLYLVICGRVKKACHGICHFDKKALVKLRWLINNIPHLLLDAPMRVVTTAASLPSPQRPGVIPDTDATMADRALYSTGTQSMLDVPRPRMSSGNTNFSMWDCTVYKFNRPVYWHTQIYASIKKRRMFLTTWKLAWGVPDKATYNVCKQDSKHCNV